MSVSFSVINIGVKPYKVIKYAIEMCLEFTPQTGITECAGYTLQNSPRYQMTKPPYMPLPKRSSEYTDSALLNIIFLDVYSNNKWNLLHYRK